MRRLDWQLVRPLREDTSEGRRAIEELRQVHARARDSPFQDPDHRRSDLLEDRFVELTIGACEAVSAPVVEDDPDWQSRAIDEYADTDLDLELEDYMESRRAEPDCERCPYASPYSLFPMDPCEFSAGPFEAILVDADLVARVARPAGPDQMRELANALESALREGRFREIEILDARDYLAKGVFFLRFWSDHGFGIEPEDIDETADTFDSAPQEQADISEPGEGSTTVH